MILTVNKLFGPESSQDARSTSKSFSFSMPFSRSKQPGQTKPTKMTLSQIKLQFELCIQDLQGNEAEKLRYKIRAVRDVRELWLLRSDLHQAISMRAGQHIAVQSINKLLPCFAGWIPSKQLSEI